MLVFQNVALRRGSRLLFQGVSFTVYPGWKIGITGANGCGKSSLLGLVRGELHTDQGEVSLPSGIVMAHVAQETPAVATPAIDYVMDGDQELRRIEAELATAEQAEAWTRQAELFGQLETIGGYQARARAARLMHGLGFGAEQLERPVQSFSGGWRMRLNLARALMCRSDLLMLDEPTNHLDLDAVIWLQDWLKAYPGTLLLISHDRDFLDEVAGHIAHMEGGGLTLYSGNYTAFERLRAERLAQQQAAHERQQREVKHIQSYVDRFRVQATKARQAQSRLKALERMELIAPAHVDSPFSFTFAAPRSVPRPLFQMKDVSVGYGPKPVLKGVSLDLQPGDRIGLLGHNGAGKSTFIKLLAGELPAVAGVVQPARGIQVGYFAQHQLEQLRGEESPLWHVQRLDPQAQERDLRSFLGSFAFSGDIVQNPVAPLSGGEKARLVLALLVYQRPNLLLLDEPTNHLDLDMRHALTLALQDYEGALIVVSHDRHLLRTVADRFLLVGQGAVTPFDGDLDDYRAWLAKEDTAPDAATDASPAAAHTADGRKERRREDADRRRELQPYRREVERLEKRIAALQTQQATLDTALADPAIYQAEHKARLTSLLAERGTLAGQLTEVEEAWMAASEALETAERN